MRIISEVIMPGCYVFILPVLLVYGNLCRWKFKYHKQHDGSFVSL
jgi:hypothetical protein